MELCSHTLPEQQPHHYQAQKNSNHIYALSYLQGVLLALDERQSVTINLEICLLKTAEVKWWSHLGNASKERSLVLTFHFLPGVFEVGVNPDLKQLQTWSQPQLFLAGWSEPSSPPTSDGSHTQLGVFDDSLPSERQASRPLCIFCPAWQASRRWARFQMKTPLLLESLWKQNLLFGFAMKLR